ncbi:MAG: Hsp20/alpha crystallin family protein [candidate division Zixibacteria bacterium]|nr:Hsp20/alpha crystallin family protein [candidate division Zixibacteria bacterium]
MRNLMLRPSQLGFPGQLDSFFDDFLRTPFWGQNDGKYLPAVDIAESENDYTLTFELPGIDKKDIKVGIEDGVLTVSGERKLSREEKGENFIRTEIAGGSFSRSFTLPKTVDVAKISAEYKDGLLTVKLGKSDVAKPKQIEVKVS